MTEPEVNMFLAGNAKMFEPTMLHAIKSSLLTQPESKTMAIKYTTFKDPVVSLIISLFFGSFGIDRFFIGDVGLGVLKLITFGGFGFWTIIDWFLIMGATRKVNTDKILQICRF